MIAAAIRLAAVAAIAARAAAVEPFEIRTFALPGRVVQADLVPWGAPLTAVQVPTEPRASQASH